MNFNDYLNEKLEDKELKKEYDKLGPEYEIISLMVRKRKELGITQIELAKKVGTDQSRISRLEKGTLNPSLNFLKKIAEGLGEELHITFTPKTI